MRRWVAIAVAVEVAVCGWLAVDRLRRPRATLPTTVADDPQIGAEFAALARRAENGGAREWLFLGESLLGQGLYGHAERAFERALALDPANVEAAHALGFVVDRTGRVAEGNAHLRRCLEIIERSGQQHPQRSLVLYAIGRNHLRLGDVPAAEAAFRRNEGFLPAMFQLARILYHSDRPKEAAELLERLLEREPLALELHHLNARVMERLGRPAEQFAAAAMEERSAHLVETSFGTDYVQPFVKRHRRSDPAVADGAAASVGSDHGRGVELFRAALAAYRRNRLPEARGLLRRAAELAPEDATTWYHLGEMEYHLGDPDAADEAFRRALALRPGYGRSRDFLDRRPP